VSPCERFVVGGSGLRLHLVESGLRLDAADLEARLAILRARHVTVDAAGHHPHVERPEAFADVVIRFLADAA
jgi:pimeloyl-ACP methyl ester carboxylesterase